LTFAVFELLPAFTALPSGEVPAVLAAHE